MTFSIPTHKCGLVIGRGGENVKAINQQTGAFVEISRQLPPNGDPNFKLFVIRGSPQQIDHAKQLIEEKIEGPLCPVGPGPGGPGPAGPMGPFNPGPFNQGPPGAPPHAGGPLLTSTCLRAGAIPTPSGNHLPLMTQTKLQQQLQTLMLPGPPTTPTTTSNPQAPCQALPQPLQPHLRKGSPPSLHLLANQTIPRLGKSITKKLASSPSSLGRPHSRITPRPGRSTTRSKHKWPLVGVLEHPLAPSLTTVPPGLSITDSRLLTTDRPQALVAHSHLPPSRDSSRQVGTATLLLLLSPSNPRPPSILP